MYDFSSILILFGSKFFIMVMSRKKTVYLFFDGYIFHFITLFNLYYQYKQEQKIKKLHWRSYHGARIKK